MSLRGNWSYPTAIRFGAGRIRELAERYAAPLPTLVDEVALLAARVDVHLRKMGAEWN